MQKEDHRYGGLLVAQSAWGGSVSTHTDWRVSFLSSGPRLFKIAHNENNGTALRTLIATEERKLLQVRVGPKVGKDSALGILQSLEKQRLRISDAISLSVHLSSTAWWLPHPNVVPAFFALKGPRA